MTRQKSLVLIPHHASIWRKACSFSKSLAQYHSQSLQLLLPIICITIVWTYSTMRSMRPTKTKDIRGQEKDEKDRYQKMVSRLPRFDDLFKDTIYYLLWMNAILLVQRTLTYHRNLLVNHASHACKIANHASRHDVPSRITRLIWSHAANFGAITRHAKTALCHPLERLQKVQPVWARAQYFPIFKSVFV